MRLEAFGNFVTFGKSAWEMGGFGESNEASPHLKNGLVGDELEEADVGVSCLLVSGCGCTAVCESTIQPAPSCNSGRKVSGAGESLH